MPRIPRFPRFRYLDWFKARAPRARIFLANSGIPHLDLKTYGIDPGDMTLEIEDFHGWPPLTEAVAAAYGAAADEVLTTPSCTYANYVAVRTLLRGGDHAVIETPTYELLRRQVGLAGAEVTAVTRSRADGYGLDLDALAAAIRPATRAIILTSPHNPSGRRLSAAERDALADLADARDLHVLVDEVYIDGSESDIASHFRTGGRFVVTSGLTKIYGLGQGRIGWVLAAPELIEDMTVLNEHVADRVAAFSAQLGAAVLTEPLRSEIRSIVRDFRERGLPFVSDFAATRSDVTILDPGAGSNVLLEIGDGTHDTLAVCEELLERHGVLLVPGEMFDDRGVLRVSLSAAKEDLRSGLDALGDVLDG